MSNGPYPQRIRPGRLCAWLVGLVLFSGTRDRYVLRSSPASLRRCGGSRYIVKFRVLASGLTAAHVRLHCYFPGPSVIFNWVVQNHSVPKNRTHDGNYRQKPSPRNLTESPLSQEIRTLCIKTSYLSNSETRLHDPESFIGINDRMCDVTCALHTENDTLF